MSDIKYPRIVYEGYNKTSNARIRIVQMKKAKGQTRDLIFEFTDRTDALGAPVWDRITANLERIYREIIGDLFDRLEVLNDVSSDEGDREDRQFELEEELIQTPLN